MYMKENRVSICFLCILIMFECTYGYCLEWNETAADGTEIMDNLSTLDILRSPEMKFNDNSHITRREAIQMVYIVKNEPLFSPVFVENRRQYLDLKRYVGVEEFESMEDAYKEFAEYYRTIGAIDVDFRDLKTDEDYKLAASLVRLQLLSGRECDGELYAAFDENLTYNEALAFIVRMLVPSVNGVLWRPFNPENGHSFLEIAEEYGLVCNKADKNYRDIQDSHIPVFIRNMTNAEAGVIYVDDGMLDSEIPAYEYFKIFYRALFEETQLYDEFGDSYGRLIDLMFKEIGEEKTGIEDILL